MIDITDNRNKRKAKIIVAGVGGAGNNAINRMVEDGVEGIDLLGINTDMKALRCCKAGQVQIGEKTDKRPRGRGNPGSRKESSFRKSDRDRAGA